MNIVDLPNEILLTIGTFITKDDIIAAATTCHTLHKALASHLWDQLILPAQQKSIPVDVNILKAHAHFVHCLTYLTTISPDYAIPFPVLTNLAFEFSKWPVTLPGTIPPPDRDSYLASIIRLCPRVKNLTLTNATPCPAVQLWEAVFSTLESPQRLSVTCMDPTDNPSMQAFWRACSRFEELELVGFDILSTNDLPTLLFPRLKSLTQQLSPYYRYTIGHEGHLAWMMRCPNLTALEWRASCSSFPGWELVEAILHNTWPLLDSFELIGTRFEDETSALMLEHLPPLQVFRLPSRHLSELSFDQLQRRHFATLRVLDMNGCGEFTGDMVLSVLSGCPFLEDFSASYFTASGLSKRDPSRRAWVCLGLRRLKVFIAGDWKHPEVDQLVFEQLSKLVQLEELDLGDDPLRDLDGNLRKELRYQGGLQLRLDSGLDRLAGLKNLYAVEFRGTVQTIRVEEIEWMLESWPQLEEVSGELSGNSKTHEVLKEMLEQNGVANY
ncbi:hypothetical protein BGZ97_004219 [Linnemannia gamsii]|uniref:F-box domain-containing protein n=1 Tax=Linnemannia gamsii TaxID=64522 RepID=A0A9P6QTH8_9FUNG|nr:hypothetical protein BGZ97_004219 [Linnemannia gamsii]